jgi:hypothetical protein
MEVMEMSELDKSLDGSIPEPNAAVDLASFRNWKSNNMRLISFLKANVDDGEKSFLATDNVHTTWNNLVDRHEKQGPITQVHLIQEVLFISYPKDVAVWFATTDHIQDLCACIFTQAVPTQDVLFIVAMLGALKCEADHIYSEMTSHYISNKTATSKALSEHVEQEIMYKIRCENGSSQTALAMDAGKCNQGHSNSMKTCSNPICLHLHGHFDNDWWEKGGMMEGNKMRF